MHKSGKIVARSFSFTYKIIRSVSTAMETKPIEASIRKKLEQSLSPKLIDVINESYMHNVPKGAETHFKVVVVSDHFNDKPLIKRHQMINEVLKAELQGGVHALSIVAKTPDQWEGSNKKVSPSPNCMGGFGK